MHTMWNVYFFNFNFFFSFESTCLWDIFLGQYSNWLYFVTLKQLVEEKAKIFEPKNSKINHSQLANKKKSI